MMFDNELAQIIAHLPPVAAANKRVIIAIAGPPAAGKSTLAEKLVERLNDGQPARAALVPMDGFHLDNQTLDRHGTRDRKGAPHTFDAAGFVALVRGLASVGSAVSYPVFDRSIDSAIADAAQVAADTEIIVLEGNYLLLADAPWCELYPLYDVSVMVRPMMATLEKRLVARWLHYGFDEAAARAKALHNDIPNARYVLERSTDADLIFADAG